MENVYHSLQQVQMPAREEEIGRFFTGDPPPLEEDGGEEEEGGRSGPPKAKRRKIEVKALSVRMLHVSSVGFVIHCSVNGQGLVGITGQLLGSIQKQSKHII